MGRSGQPSVTDFTLGPTREQDVLFGESPIAMVFNDHELRIKDTSAAFRRLFGLPGEELIGRCLSEVDHGMDAALIERTLADQVINSGVPVVNTHLEKTLAGQRRVISWSANPVTDNGQDNARLYIREHNTAVTLQRSCRPPSPASS
jgi:PAS domain S-box-containing protein